MPEVNAYIEQGNRVLGILGYTEHSRGHAVKVAETAGDILEKLGYNEHTVELAQIAGYMHDMCKRAAEILGLKFKMKANGNKIC